MSTARYCSFIAPLQRRLAGLSRNGLLYAGHLNVVKGTSINISAICRDQSPRCSTFVFQLQRTGEHPKFRSISRLPCENATCHLTPPKRFYHGYQEDGQRFTDSNLKYSKYTIAVVSLVAVGFGLYKGKTLVSVCEDGGEFVEIRSSVDEQRAVTLEEAIAQSRDLAKRIKDETGSPGLAISVSVDGKEVWSEGLGYADVENRVPCTADTVLRIASISKSITMVAVAKQLEAGTLDLEKPIQHYLPKFPEKLVDNKKVTITTRQLVSHLGGIRHYEKEYIQVKQTDESTEEGKGEKQSKSDKTTEGEKDAKAKSDMSRAEYYITDNYTSVTDGLALFKDDPLVHEPGKKYFYTTYGFSLVSAVVEAVAKQPFEKLMKEYFIQMGMDHTYLDEHTPLIYNRGRHYMKNEKTGRLINTPYVDLSYKWAGGGFLSTTRDLVKFGHVMLYSYQQKGHSSANQTEGQSGKVGARQKSKVNKGANQMSSPDEHEKEMQERKPGFLNRESVELLWKSVAKTKCDWDKFGYYGMGWAVVPEGENYGQCHHSDHMVSHTGAAIGGSSVLLIKPISHGSNGTPHGDPPRGDPAPHGDPPRGDPPRGVVVAMIANMTSVGLYKTAVKIAKIFEEATS